MIVVLGASGRTGRKVAALSKAEGCAVRVVTRDRARLSAEAGLEVAIARLSDPVDVERALRGARALYAIMPDDLSAIAFHAERRSMADAIARAIRRQKIPRVVLLSSVAAALGERSQNGLGSDLAYFERLVLDTNAAVSILRASYFQDNAVQSLPVAERDGVYPNFLMSRELAIPTVAAVDVGAFAARALLDPPRKAREVVDLVGPAYSPTQIAAALGDVVGRRVSVLDVPTAGRRAQLERWMSPEAAQAMIETIDCLASGRLGADASGSDRVEHATTRLEQVLRTAAAGDAARVRP